MGPRSRVGDILLKAGVIDDLQLRSALAHQERWGGRLTHAVIELGLADEEELVAALSLAMGIPRVTLGTLAKDAGALARVPVAFAESKAVFPVAVRDQGKALFLAMADPSDLNVIDEASGLARARVQVAIAGEEEIARAVAKHYRGVELPAAANRARAAVQRSQRHTSENNPVVEAPFSVPQVEEEQEFSAQALGGEQEARRPDGRPPPGRGAGDTKGSAEDMLDEMLADSSPEALRGWLPEDIERLRAVAQNQEKSSLIVRALLELLVEKGLLRQSALESWKRGEPLPPIPQLRPPSR